MHEFKMHSHRSINQRPSCIIITLQVDFKVLSNIFQWLIDIWYFLEVSGLSEPTEHFQRPVLDHLKGKSMLSLVLSAINIHTCRRLLRFYFNSNNFAFLVIDPFTI